MRKVSIIVVVLLFLALAWFSWQWYATNVLCCEEEVQYGAIIFDCEGDEPVTNELWPDYKSKLFAARTNQKTLLISVPQFDGESDSVAISRGEKVKALFSTELSDEEMSVEIHPGGDCEETMANDLHGLQLNWVTRTENLTEHLNHTVVYYKYNSIEEIMTENTGAYFDELAQALISTGDTIVLVGHTDNIGSREFNLGLGYARADQFMYHLMDLGVNADQLIVESMGELQPVADNSTEAGKEMNRRVEIHFNHHNTKEE